jgi:2'-5' RNA ligase
MKRLFLATFVDQDIFRFVLDDIKDDFAGCIKGKWVEHSNLHFTFKFLGDTEESKIPEIKDALKDELKHFKRNLSFSGVGAFPNLHNPRLLYVPVFSEANILNKIAGQIESKLEKIGFAREKHKFQSHLTLIRIKEADKNTFSQKIKSYKDKQFGFMDGFDVKLVASELTNKGPIYTIID